MGGCYNYLLEFNSIRIMLPADWDKTILYDTIFVSLSYLNQVEIYEIPVIIEVEDTFLQM